MVVVREAPASKLSPTKSLSQWPPRSPFECLSPSGREKWQQERQRAAERTPSPSPLRRPASTSRVLQDLAAEAGADSDDEEALELELREIEIKKKLKRLRDAKKGDGSQGGSVRTTGILDRADSTRESPVKSRCAPGKPLSQHKHIQVPLSPIRRVQEPAEPVSPARARLGLTAAARAQDVSLKRARDGTQIRRTDSLRAHNALSTATETTKPVSSFSQRLAKSQQEQLEQEGRNERIERARTNGFAIAAAAKSSTAARLAEGMRPASRPRTERMPSPVKAAANTIAPRRTNDTAHNAPSVSASDNTPQFRAPRSVSRPQSQDDTADQDTPMDDSTFDLPPLDAQDGSGYDLFSGIHLSKRHIPHVDVARALEGSELYTLPRLLREVKAPDYDPPECESDFIVFGILAAKSSPYNQKQTHRTNDESRPQDDAAAPRNKFMVLTLTDLKWSIDLFLFGSGFDQFWKLTPGTLLAIQNPAILPPKGNQHSGAFSLKLSSCEDRVMEIGTARDLAYCVSVKKDGKQCETWVDKRSSDICDFHLNLLIDKSRKSRMEVNGMWRGTSNTDNHPHLRKGTRASDKPPHVRQPGSYSRTHGQTFTVPSGLGKSAASILDAEDKSVLTNLSQEESSRRRIAAAQKERDLAAQLAALPSTIGVDYLRAAGRGKAGAVPVLVEKGPFEEKLSAKDLGLLNNTASGARLSPAKNRKRHFGTAAVGTSGKDAMGWGGHGKWGLLQPTARKLGSPERGQMKLTSALREGSQRERSLSPSKKRARFMLGGKGVREPGRDSLGSAVKGIGDEEDDELDIV